MNSTTPTDATSSETHHDARFHAVSYFKFLRLAFRLATEGTWAFYAWMTVLTCVFLVGAHAWALQVEMGMAVTAMSDHVSWGLYIANFTFLVGLAAGGVMMVIPAYIYHDKDMHDTVIVGELLAIASSICWRRLPSVRRMLSARSRCSRPRSPNTPITAWTIAKASSSKKVRNHPHKPRAANHAGPTSATTALKLARQPGA